MKVILDTNFLMYCAKEKIDYAEDIVELVNAKASLVVPEQVIKELENLKQGAKKYSDREAAELSIKLLKANKIKTIEIPGGRTDNAIAKASPGNIVATVDKRLQNKLEKTIIIRSKKKLAFR